MELQFILITKNLFLPYARRHQNCPRRMERSPSDSEKGSGEKTLNCLLTCWWTVQALVGFDWQEPTAEPKGRARREAAWLGSLARSSTEGKTGLSGSFTATSCFLPFFYFVGILSTCRLIISRQKKILNVWESRGLNIEKNKISKRKEVEDVKILDEKVVSLFQGPRKDICGFGDRKLKEFSSNMRKDERADAEWESGEGDWGRMVMGRCQSESRVQWSLKTTCWWLNQ